MTNRNAEASPLFYARIAGAGLLLMAVLAMFSNGAVLGGLIVPGDAAATAANVSANEMLFRSGLIGFIVVLILDVLVAWALYEALKPAHPQLAALAAAFRLVYTAIFGAALYHLANVLQLLGGDGAMKGFTTEQVQAQAMLSIDSFNNGWLIGLVFFGLHLLVVGSVIAKCRGVLPRPIGIVLIVAAAGYVIDSFAHVLLPDYADYKTIFLLMVAVPGIVGELSLAFWLLMKGVKAPKAPAIRTNDFPS